MRASPFALLSFAGRCTQACRRRHPLSLLRSTLSASRIEASHRLDASVLGATSRSTYSVHLEAKLVPVADSSSSSYEFLPRDTLAMALNGRSERRTVVES